MPEIKHATTDVTRYVMIVDSTTGAPETAIDVTTLDLQYTRAGAAPVAKVDATSLAATDSAHSDNKMFEVDATSSPGLYRVDWPDAAFAAGVDSVILVVTGTGFAPAVEEITLVANRASDVATTIGAAGAGLTAVVWNADWDAEVESEVTASLVAHNLDHLMKTAVANNADMTVEVADGTVLSNIMTSDSDTSGYVVSADSLEAISDQAATIVADTNELQTDDVPTLISNLNNLSAADVNAECDTALSDINLDHLLKVADADDVTDDSVIGKMTATDGDWSNFNKATDSLQAIRDQGDAAWTTGAGGTGLNRLRSGTAQDGAAGTITLDAAASATNNLYHGTRILITGGTGVGQSRGITAYDGATKIATVHRNWITNPDATSIFEIQAADVEVGIWAGTAVTLGNGAPDVNIASTDDIDLSATQKASVNTEADNAIETYKLDHLLHTADADDVVDDSVIARLAAKGATADWSDFVNTTDSLQAIRDNQGVSTIFQGTSTAASTTSVVYVQAADTPVTAADDDYNDTIIVVYDGADKTTARVNVRVVEDYDDSGPSFTVSPALAFTPGAGDVVEVYTADAGALSMLNMLSSGFAGTSPNRLIDHLRSIMSKAAVTPASVGTYDPATDSLEKQSETLALATGAGFATGTDSLKEIRDAIDILVAPSVVSSSALSGSGFLSDCVSLIRKAVDEPSITPKYTDSDIVEILQVAIDQVLTEISTATDHPVIVRHSITLVDGVQDYILPPQVGELLRIAKMNTTTNLPEYEEYPGSYHCPAGCGWKLEGNILRLLRDYDSTDTLELMYVPNAEPLIHKGTAEAVTATTVTLMAIPTDGTLGTRPNEYVGMIIRVLSSTENIKEERVITAYDVTTRIATINKAWDTTPTGVLVYEVVPVFGRLVKHVCVLRASIDLLSNEGNSQRMNTLERNYLLKMSAMRRSLSKKEGRFPHHFDGDTWDNTNRLGY